MALTAAAGPISNIIMAFIGALLHQIFSAIFTAFPASTQFSANLQFAVIMLLAYFHTLNLSLGLFNLIPVPPLDGSRIFYVFLPPKFYFGIMKYEHYIQMVLMVLLWTGILTTPLSYAVSFLSGLMVKLIQLLPFI